MTSVLPITTRNLSARLVLNNGARVALREVLLGEQIKLSSGKFAEEVTPMRHGRFRLIQVKNGLRAPIDLTAQHVDKMVRRGGSEALGPMPRPAPEDVGIFDIIQQGLPFSGTVQSFFGRVVVHGRDEKTQEMRVVLLSDVQVLEVKRRKPEPRTTPVVAGDELVAGEGELEVEVTITARDTQTRPDEAAIAEATATSPEEGSQHSPA